MGISTRPSINHGKALTALMVFFIGVSFACRDQGLKGDQKGSIQSTGGTEGKEGHKYVPGEILVKFREGTDKQAIETIQKKVLLKTKKVVSKAGLYLMEIQDGSSVEEVMERLKEYDKVEYSEPNYLRRAF